MKPDTSWSERQHTQRTQDRKQISNSGVLGTKKYSVNFNYKITAKRKFALTSMVYVTVTTVERCTPV